MHFPMNGKTVRESTKTSDPKKADRILRKRLSSVDRGEFTGVDVQKITVGELLDDLKANYERYGKSVDWAQIVINHLRPHFGYVKAARVGTSHIDAYIAARSVDVVDSTINRELALLRRAFYLGTKTEPIKVARVPLIPRLTEGPARRGFFERADLDRLVAELPKDIAAIARFAYFTGCRKAEILSLRWDWVDLVDALVSLPGEITKSGEPRSIPLVAEIVSDLSALKAERDEYWSTCPWVFSRAGRPIKDFYSSWRAACERANLPEGTRLLHDMRRSGVRNMVRAGIPERVAMSISGHKTRSVFDRYNIVNKTDIKEARSRLEAFGAVGEGRTPNPLRERGPEPRASANSATTAKEKPAQKLHKTSAVKQKKTDNKEVRSRT